MCKCTFNVLALLTKNCNVFSLGHRYSLHKKASHKNYMDTFTVTSLLKEKRQPIINPRFKNSLGDLNAD